MDGSTPVTGVQEITVLDNELVFDLCEDILMSTHDTPLELTFSVSYPKGEPTISNIVYTVTY
jgi:hypothetical protein